MEWLFSKGHMVLPYLHSHLSAQSTCALLCLGQWSKLGLVKDNDLCNTTSGECHDHDTRSTLYHSVQSRPRIYRPFHCMYLCFPIASIFLVSLPIGECFVQSVFPYNYLICFRLRSQLLSVPVPLYLLIRYASGNWPQTSPGLLIVLRWSSACPTPRASPHTFYNSI